MKFGGLLEKPARRTCTNSPAALLARATTAGARAALSDPTARQRPGDERLTGGRSLVASDDDGIADGIVGEHSNENAGKQRPGASENHRVGVMPHGRARLVRHSDPRTKMQANAHPLTGLAAASVPAADHVGASGTSARHGQGPGLSGRSDARGAIDGIEQDRRHHRTRLRRIAGRWLPVPRRSVRAERHDRGGLLHRACPAGIFTRC